MTLFFSRSYKTVFSSFSWPVSFLASLWWTSNYWFRCSVFYHFSMLLNYYNLLVLIIISVPSSPHTRTPYTSWLARLSCVFLFVVHVSFNFVSFYKYQSLWSSFLMVHNSNISFALFFCLSRVKDLAHKIIITKMSVNDNNSKKSFSCNFFPALFPFCVNFSPFAWSCMIFDFEVICHIVVIDYVCYYSITSFNFLLNINLDFYAQIWIWFTIAFNAFLLRTI